MRNDPRLMALRLLLRRLATRSRLTAADTTALLDLPAQAMRVRAHIDFVRLGETVDHCCLVAEGLVARFCQLEDGRRQIVGLHIPGDMVDLQSLVLPHAPSSSQALSPAVIVRVPHAALQALIETSQTLATALWRDTLVDASIGMQAVVSAGRRDARGRLAHLLCEMAVRYGQIGAVEGRGYRFPITQEQLADTLGLTPVHVNRTLRMLREEGLVIVASNRIDILDWPGLRAAAEFDPAYLCLGTLEAPADGRTMQASA